MYLGPEDWVYSFLHNVGAVYLFMYLTTLAVAQIIQRRMINEGSGRGLI
jgi:hypothetical protein